MNHIFRIKMGLESGTNQSELIQLIKNQGGEAIQTSDGLCVRLAKDKSEFEKVLKEKEMSGLIVQPLDPEADDLTPDIKAFISVH